VVRPSARLLEGTIARVRNLDDLMVVRTPSGKEVLLDFASRADLTINNKPALLKQSRPGMPVQVQFEVRDGKNMAQSVVVTSSLSP
jgi:hypothetical protein